MKKVFFISTSVVLFLVFVLLLLNVFEQRRRVELLPQQDPAENTTNTGIVTDAVPTTEVEVSADTAVRPYLPATLETSHLSFNYKQNKLQLNYCQDLGKALDEVKAFLKEKNILASLDEQRVIFVSQAQCP